MSTEVRMSGEFGGWPLWTHFEEGMMGPTLPEDWPMLSDSLKQELLAWNDDYLSTTMPRPLSAWRRRGDVRAYIRKANALVARVQSELGDAYSVRWSA